MIAEAKINVPGPFTDESIQNPLSSVGGIISLAFQIILAVAAIYAFLQIIFAGYGMISSGGDKGHLEQARGKIIWAIVGLFVVIAAWGLIILVEKLLGVGLGFSDPIDLSL